MQVLQASLHVHHSATGEDVLTVLLRGAEHQWFRLRHLLRAIDRFRPVLAGTRSLLRLLLPPAAAAASKRSLPGLLRGLLVGAGLLRDLLRGQLRRVLNGRASKSASGRPKGRF